MRRIVRTGALLLATVIGALAVYARLHYSPAGSVVPAERVAHVQLPLRLRNGSEHDAARTRNGGNPYVLEFDVEGQGALLYYGASHTTDPDDPQIADIAARWDRFEPTVALYEGRSRGFFYGSLIEPFAGLPEPALVHKLARRDDVALYRLEPAYEDEVAELLGSYSAEQVALYFFLRVYASEAGGQANEDLARDLLAKRTDVDGLVGSLSGLEDVDRVWRRDYASEGDWRTLQAEPRFGYLAGISDMSRAIRGRHMARVLVDLVRRDERVLAVVGSGHVIRQEWNLRALLGEEPAWDQELASDRPR